MKGDTVLDLVVFQLTAPRTRCELFVSANGMTEKLASGFLKPFLNHLRAVEKQVIAGYESVKLKRPQIYHDRSWFTKGTLERFVRFVSTPEVLERVKFIEDELEQLEQVRGIQASSLRQVEDSYSTAEPVYQRNDGKAFSGPLGTFEITKLGQNYPYDAVDSRREASKVELLRAMDVRVLALRQEQNMAFSRAAAAGFSSDNMIDLIAFSEFFGADRLRKACFNFLAVLERRVMGPTKASSEAVSSDCGMPDDASEVSMLPKQQVLPEFNLKLTEVDVPNDDHQIKDEWRHMIKIGVEPLMDKKLSFEPNSFNLPSSGSSTIEPEGLNFVQGFSINHASGLLLPNQISSSIKPSVGSVEKQTNANLSIAPSPNSAPARRLSVHDAINLFENKQRREYLEAPSKERIGKHNSGRASLEGTNASLSASVGARRWSIANSNAAGNLLQENLMSSKQEPPLISSGTARHDVDALLSKEEHYGAGLKSKATALCQPCSDETSVKASNIEKQSSENSALEYEAQGPVQFKLGRSIAQGTLSGMPEEQGPLTTGSNLTVRSTCFLNAESDGQSLDKNPEDKVPAKVAVGTTSKSVAMQGSSILHAPSKRSDADLGVMSSCERERALGVSGVSGQQSKDVLTMDFIVSEKATLQSSSSESFERMRADSLQSNVHNLVQMNISQIQDDVYKLNEQKGRFYEQYRKLRDAKLKEENEFKKSEREAKLRLMEETLLLRKAELDAETIKLSTRNHQQVRVMKLQARKANLHTVQRAKEDAVDERYKDISSYSRGRARSPPSTLSSGKKEVSTSKSPSRRKSFAGLQKGETPPRSSKRGTSLSPKLTPRSVPGSTTKLRKPVASGMNDNSLGTSIPSFANLRKENTKPLAGSPSANTGLQTEVGDSGRLCTSIKAQCLEANGNILVCTPLSIPGSAKDNSLPAVLRSHCDLRMTPRLNDESASVPPAGQREVESEPGSHSSWKCDGSSLLQEIQQSTKEASAQKPGVHTFQQMSLPLVGPLGSDEGRILETKFLGSEVENYTHRRLEDTDSKDAFVEESAELGIGDFDRPIDLGGTNVLEMQLMTTATALTEETAEDDATLETKRPYQTTFSPTYIETHQQFAAGGLSEGGQEKGSLYVADVSTSSRAISLPQEHRLPTFSCNSTSPPYSRVEKIQKGTVYGHFSSPPAADFDSPRPSPAYWNASQIQYASGPQKLVPAVSTKEPAKGLKKLLMFGRKNRAPDAPTFDWTSSYTSEGDDESEDLKYSTDPHNAKGRLDESKAINIKGEQCIAADKTSAAQSLRSSIPTPPANFKIRDDHLMGGTMLKAPKSFFSLSSFRSRGTEGRA